MLRSLVNGALRSGGSSRRAGTGGTGTGGTGTGGGRAEGLSTAVGLAGRFLRRR
jgi:hypothetical protein